VTQSGVGDDFSIAGLSNASGMMTPSLGGVPGIGKHNARYNRDQDDGSLSSNRVLSAEEKRANSMGIEMAEYGTN
jgi:hypothetical protein